MRELAQLVDRDRDLGERAVERVAGALRRGRAELVLCVTQRQPDRDEPLLGAVVEVALDPPALLVAGRDDPRPRGLDLGELAAQLDAQSRDLDREPAGLDDLPQQGRDPPASRGSWSTMPSGWPPRSIGIRSRPSSGGVGDGYAARVDVELALRAGRSGAPAADRSSTSRRTALDLLRRGPAGAQVFEEVGHPPQRVVAGAVEAPIDRVLHPRAQRAKGDRDDERGRGGRPPRTAPERRPEQHDRRRERRGQDER